MDRLRKAAILTRLVEKLREKNSWCGETHIQKAVFLLQELTKVPLKYDFILYKHGPFAFDLRDELTALRADNLIVIDPQEPPYGPRINITERSSYLQTKYTRTLSLYENNINFVTNRLGSKGVAELERLATAFFVTQQGQADTSPQHRTKILSGLKPHISFEHGLAAMIEIDSMIESVKQEIEDI